MDKKDKRYRNKVFHIQVWTHQRIILVYPYPSVDAHFLSDKFSRILVKEQWGHATFTDIFQLTKELLDRMENSFSFVEGTQAGGFNRGSIEVDRGQSIIHQI